MKVRPINVLHSSSYLDFGWECVVLWASFGKKCQINDTSYNNLPCQVPLMDGQQLQSTNNRRLD